jgi:benzoyl-CoA reductase/2-hydroxyglutaryl-CoA dehydratase subunit BcrC/BadD/HgdB
MKNTQSSGRIGFTCAYTPLPIIEAAGFAPYRVLPMGDAPDQAGQLLHDNLCPHVKRVIDRVMSDDLPELRGMVIINSCDAMRRLADAWRRVRPGMPVVLLDLPATHDAVSNRFYASELQRWADHLAQWAGIDGNALDVPGAVTAFNRLCELLVACSSRMRKGRLTGGSARMQAIYNMASTRPTVESIRALEAVLAEDDAVADDSPGVPVFLFGNVMPDPEAFNMFESSGARIVGDDFCTGARMFSPVVVDSSDEIFMALARSIQQKPPCARTFTPAVPGQLAADVVTAARACGAVGVIGHTLKFCDPYLARLPMVREALKNEGLPVLLLEGDCTLRSIGQQRTRIEAFIEMLR